MKAKEEVRQRTAPSFDPNRQWPWENCASWRDMVLAFNLYESTGKGENNAEAKA